MSYPQADNRIVTYPLNSVIGSGGAPRYAFIEPAGGKIIIESDRISPLEAGNLVFSPKTEMIPANVLSPTLPYFLRNSLLDLDSYQNVTGKIENERDLEALQQELAMENSQMQRLAEDQEKESSKIGTKEIAAISGIGLTVTIVLYLILRKNNGKGKGKGKKK